MDDHDITEGRGRLSKVLKSITQKALVMGIRSDELYPEAERTKTTYGVFAQRKLRQNQLTPRT